MLLTDNSRKYLSEKSKYYEGIRIPFQMLTIGSLN